MTASWPGLWTGVVSGAIAGGLAASAGAPAGAAALAALAFALPLAAFGAAYDLLARAKRVRPDGLAEAALYWSLAFPLAKAALDLVLGQPASAADSWAARLSYYVLVGSLYGVGFAMLRARIASLASRQRSHRAYGSQQGPGQI